MDHPAARIGGHWSEAASSPKLGLRPLPSLSVRVRPREGRAVKLVRRSHELERRRDGQAMMANRRWQRGSEVVLLELREEGRRVEMGAARTGQGPHPL
jgi:hypothetical protein